MTPASSSVPWSASSSDASGAAGGVGGAGAGAGARNGTGGSGATGSAVVICALPSTDSVSDIIRGLGTQRARHGLRERGVAARRRRRRRLLR